MEDRLIPVRTSSLTVYKCIEDQQHLADGKVLDFGNMPMPANRKYWTWQEDSEGTHELITVTGEDGSERRRFVKVKAKSAALTTKRPAAEDEPAARVLRSGKKRKA
jgi:hypothetical protein